MKVFYISRKMGTLIAGVLVVALIVGVWIFAAATDSSTQETMAVKGESHRELPIYNVKTEEKKVAITFDAAWGEEKTAGLLELLEQYDIDATFFLIGYWVDQYPDNVKAIAEAGHEIGSHSDTHPYMTKLSTEEMQKELSTVAGKIKAITGSEPSLFRAPYGDYNDAVVKTVRGEGLEMIQWDVDSLDWKGLSGDEMLVRVKKKVQPGSILLFHNNSENLLDGVKKTLDYLKAEGYSFCRVSELIYPEPYTIAPNGMQQMG